MKISTRIHTDGTRIFVKPGDITHLATGAKRHERIIFGYEPTKEPITRIEAIRYIRAIVQEALRMKRTGISLDWANLMTTVAAPFASDPYDAGLMLARELELANYKFEDYMSKKRPSGGLRTVYVGGTPLDGTAEEGIEAGMIIGQSMNWSRTVSNMPALNMHPYAFYEAAKAFLGKGVSIRIATDKETKGMGLFLGVARGSSHKPAFLIAEYWGAGKKVAPRILIGKGVTFDTGGHSMKDSTNMLGMHLDMSGAAIAMATLHNAARLGLKQNIVVLTPMTDNAIGPKAIVPGDILKSLDGMTVEVGNTDAEGRLVMADALTFAKQHYKPLSVTTIATLTGAVVVALGKRTSGLFSNNDELAAGLLLAGKESGNRLWRLPLWPEYVRELKSDRADICNISLKASRDGGAITAAVFLDQFVQGAFPYAHIDMAGRDESIADDNLAPCASGEPIAALTSWLMSL